MCIVQLVRLSSPLCNEVHNPVHHFFLLQSNARCPRIKGGCAEQRHVLSLRACLARKLPGYQPSCRPPLQHVDSFGACCTGADP